MADPLIVADPVVSDGLHIAVYNQLPEQSRCPTEILLFSSNFLASRKDARPQSLELNGVASWRLCMIPFRRDVASTRQEAWLTVFSQPARVNSEVRIESAAGDRIGSFCHRHLESETR